MENPPNSEVRSAIQTENQHESLLSYPAETLIQLFTATLEKFSYPELFAVLVSPETPLISTIIRTAIKSKQNAEPFRLSLEQAERRTVILLNNRRKKFARRTWKTQPLFALEVIRQKYPHYTEEILTADLILVKPRKRREKFVKRTSEFGLRICQIRKLSGIMKLSDPESPKYYKCCNQIAGYMQGLKNRSPISLQVNYSGESFQYDFPWNSRESDIKAFIAITKKVGSFKELDEQWSSYHSSGK
ncbi:hypothetical protein [Pedobacter hiemivivus]|uniref:Uncharacterized protein n=1 Tax=Pedobacter hiemivivus TaxID=2530454 RepID=A0A4R0NEE2_9SPHI|nr:hypothetical protein [Pedobacter hiemivivus]TCC98801.1 hypothetical protein EZ444_05870 [Pedobacter hiemivivus]